MARSFSHRGTLAPTGAEGPVKAKNETRARKIVESVGMLERGGERIMSREGRVRNRNGPADASHQNYRGGTFRFGSGLAVRAPGHGG